MERKYRWITLFWICTALILFAVLVALGIVMRMNQARLIDIPAERFYAYMTLHGLGMAGTLFVAALGGLWYLLSRYLNLSRRQMWVVYVSTVLGVVLLLIANLVGHFGAGWYMLYPLPFLNATWPYWSIGVQTLGLTILGVAWLAALLDILRAMSDRYGIVNSLGWQYFMQGKTMEVPPIIIIAAVSSIAGVLALTTGGIMLVLFLLNWFTPEVLIDPLLMKNLVFLFGHTLVNLTMYFGVAIVYELLPEFTGRPWKTNKYVVISWNATFALVLGAFLHHLYMDFAQPMEYQVIGQVASYLSPIPATVITIFGAIGQVYRSGMKLTPVTLGFLLGFFGWLVGGFGAAVDSTIAVNVTFHNTMWVPGHFHTYFLVGFVFIVLGFTAYLVEKAGGEPAPVATMRGLWTMAAGGFGFVGMFYLGGLMGVPRRFAHYAAIPLSEVRDWGELTAKLAVYALAVFVFGLLVTYIGIFCGRRSNAPESPAPGEPPHHWLRRLMDNPWLLLALGFLLTLFSYTFWGWFELGALETATLP